MSTHHINILNSIIAASGGQAPFAAALTMLLRESRPDAVAISQQRVSKWVRGSVIDPAVCPLIVRLAAGVGIQCSLVDLHKDADLIWL